MPNAAYALLIAIAGSIAVAGPSATARLLFLAGGADASFADGGVSLRCMLVPTAADVPIHLVTYVLLAIGMLGAVAGASSLIAEYRRTRRLTHALLARRRPIPPALTSPIAAVGLDGRVDVVEAPEPIGFSFGLVRPRVCLTTGLLQLLTTREIEAVLRHEAYHVQNRDPLRVLLGRVLVATLFIVPSCRDLLGHYRRHVEVTADRAATGQMGEVQSLASALAKLLDAPRLALRSLPGVHGGSVELRIDNLLGKPTKLSVWAMLPRLGLSTIGLLVVAAPAMLFIGDHWHLSVLMAVPHLPC